MSTSRSLREIPIGTVVVLQTVVGETEVRRRMAELGLRAGATVQIIQRTSGGGRLLGVSGSRIAIDAATTQAVLVTDRDEVPV